MIESGRREGIFCSAGPQWLAAGDRARPTFNPDAALLGPSFPSGHSSQAAAFFAAAALLLARRRVGVT